jgi:hypothetical protein
MAIRGVQKTALKLAFVPDDYLCTWYVPLGDGTFVDVNGSLTVQARRPPTGQMFGELPIEWNADSPGVRSAAFPQDIDLDILTGRLATGANVVLLRARVSYWFHSQGHVSSAAAVLTLDEVAKDDQPRFSRVELQITGLDAVAGVAPLQAMSLPSREGARHLEGIWSAEGNPESSQEWSDDSATVRLEYDAAVRAFDPYAYRMGFSPVLRIEAVEPLTLHEWIDQWVEPVRRIISIASATAQDVTYLATRRASGERSTVRGQVFGSGITQEPYESSQAGVQEAEPALLLKSDEVSLLAIVRRWQRLEVERHPLIETYASMLAHDQHPRSRFLLLIQAIEGLHGSQRAADYANRQKRHDEKRANLIQAVREHLDSASINFMKRHLRKNPPTSLEDALRDIFSALPTDLTPELDRTELVATVKADNPDAGTSVGALRIVRNDLAHGVRGYEPLILQEVVRLLERVVRTEALRLLGCPESVQKRALQPVR